MKQYKSPSLDYPIVCYKLKYVIRGRPWPRFWLSSRGVSIHKQTIYFDFLEEHFNREARQRDIRYFAMDIIAPNI